MADNVKLEYTRHLSMELFGNTSQMTFRTKC